MRRAPAGEAGSAPESRLTCYPRIDPAVIALVTCEGHALLGRQSRWPPGRYSLLAGAALSRPIGLQQIPSRSVESSARSGWLLNEVDCECHVGSREITSILAPESCDGRKLLVTCWSCLVPGGCHGLASAGSADLARRSPGEVWAVGSWGMDTQVLPRWARRWSRRWRARWPRSQASWSTRPALCTLAANPGPSRAPSCWPSAQPLRESTRRLCSCWCPPSCCAPLGWPSSKGSMHACAQAESAHHAARTRRARCADLTLGPSEAVHMRACTRRPRGGCARARAHRHAERRRSRGCGRRRWRRRCCRRRACRPSEPMAMSWRTRAGSQLPGCMPRSLVRLFYSTDTPLMPCTSLRRMP